MEQPQAGSGAHLIDPDMDTSELAGSNDFGHLADGVETQPAELSIPETQHTAAAKVDGDDTAKLPRDGSPPPRVHIQGGLLLPMNVEVDGDELATGDEDGRAVRVDADDVDQVEILDESGAMPDRVGRALRRGTMFSHR